MTILTEAPLPPDRRVRVWFGEHLIADYIGDAEDAAQYEAGMRRRFLCLRVTNEPADLMGALDADHEPAGSVGRHTGWHGREASPSCASSTSGVQALLQSNKEWF
jgi:hypothetical protein